MSKTFIYDRFDIWPHDPPHRIFPTSPHATSEFDGDWVKAEDAINREAVLQAEIRTLQVQLKDARAPQWQPIESAPKTGRTLLLGYKNGCDKWRTVRGQWVSEAYIAEHWEEPDDAEAGWYETSVEADDVPNCWPVTPTHWQPLPSAPKESA